MAQYIFTERNGIYIIDLQKTVKKLDEAYMFVRDIAAEGGSILFVGTKKQAGDSVKEEAERCGMHYVNARWLGGMMKMCIRDSDQVVRDYVMSFPQSVQLRDKLFDLIDFLIPYFHEEGKSQLVIAVGRCV